MKVILRGGAIAVLLTSCCAFAQPPADGSQGATIQALLKEVHALRVALEQSNQIGPRIQIALARIQFQEERVRNATRELQEARAKVAEIPARRGEMADRIKQIEDRQAQVIEPLARKQMDFELIETKAALERLNTLEQQYRAKEADANSLFLNEQSKSNEANDMLKSIERSLIPSQP